MERNNWVESYLQESEDLLAGIEETALSLSAGEEDTPEKINKLFRAFHTIKGSGAMCGFSQVAGFTHHVESLLDKVRAGALPVTPGLTNIVLSARDHIKALIAAESANETCPDGSSLITEIQQFSGEAAAPVAAVEPVPATVAVGTVRTWNIRFRPASDMLACGGNPILLFRELQELGSCEIAACVDAVPALEEIQPDTAYLVWDITLQTAADLNTIRDVFIFVEDGAELKIDCLDAAPVTPAPAPADAPALAQTPAAAATAQRKEPFKVERRKNDEATVRVPSGRLDQLVNLVGELVMNQSRLMQAASLVGASELDGPIQENERLVAELRDDVLGIRMLPIGAIFGRFRRLVHDLSAELGKEVDLVTEGEETELDKSILDQLGEPLVHLLRNCVDHGVEPADVRVANGKPRRATIRLRAVHTGSEVVVSIQDDGRGINREAVRAKAIERGLITPETVLSDKELINLVLLPGFSTAAQVTNVSGRGVGMDVVKRQIETLRGTLTIASDEGRGTTISLGLPLTLAIIEGLVVQVGSDQFIIPMALVTENIDLDRTERARSNGRNVTAVRGELIPYIDLREEFHVDGEPPLIEKVVIVQHEGERVGMVVDHVIGTHQTVLQSLGRFLRNVKVVSGATIMGDGRVALIMDIPAVVRFAEEDHSRTD
jgi:two-component system chemotaxis sensor kinase CheA